MFSKVLQMITCAGILLILTYILLLHKKRIVDLVQVNNVLNLRPRERLLGTYSEKQSNLQVLEPAQFDDQSDFTCIKVTLGDLSFPMCIYNPENDTIVSKRMVDGIYFESHLVQKVLNLLNMHPNMSFVDLGANIGLYSLPVAHAGHHVVSVEPNKDTVRRLAKSVHLGRIGHNVDLLHYALSYEESTTFLKFDASNRGDTFMVGNASCPGCLSAKVTVLNKLIPFIRHKKVFIKVDVQGAEIKIFQSQSAAKFFEEIDVLMIQMEWGNYPVDYGKTEEEKRKVDYFLDFFYERGYDVYDPGTEIKLGADWTKWTWDVVFKKDNLPKNRLFMI